MLNILSYVGMSLQSEVCLWTLLGLVRTIFDATLFKVNANLKQVWQMSMPEELSRSVQRVLRTMISGIMLVQCFTVYVYLASYIVLLYPVFLEERPTLVLPWLLLAAIRKLLCELTSLALGLGTCVLLGPARPPCIKFVVIKVISIMPSFYMWMLLYTYYHVLKVASVFKSFPVVLPPSEHDYGLELAVRRRRTKSLLGEEQLRTSLIANLYSEHRSIASTDIIHHKTEYSSRMSHGTDTSNEDLIKNETIILRPLSTTSNRMISDIGYEDWFGSEVMMPRDNDRILDQFGLMMLRIGAYISKERDDSYTATSQIFNSTSTIEPRRDNLDSAPMPPDDTDPPPLVGSSKGKTASYLRDYPQIFMKKLSEMPLPSDITMSLTSDDRISTYQKHRNQTLNDEGEISRTIACKLSDENVSEDVGSRTFSECSSSKMAQKKLQTRSSEKSVSFKQLKRKSTLEDVHSIELSEPEINDIELPSEKDSLLSIIEKMRNYEANKRFFKKDEDEHEISGTSSGPSLNNKQDKDSPKKHNVESNTPKNDLKKSRNKKQ